MMLGIMSALFARISCFCKFIRSEHKFENKSGYASFWTTIEDAIEVTPADGTKLNIKNVLEPEFKNKNLDHSSVTCKGVV